MSGLAHRLNVAAGNFFFKYRNGLFPVTFLVFLLVMRPEIFGGRPALDRLLRITGIFIALAGELIRLSTIGFEYIERGGKEGRVYASRLVQKGVYGLTRNPMYVGNFLIAVGLVMFSGVPAAYVTVIPFFFFVYQAIIAAESEYLRKAFGAEYEAYCARVPWFLPSFRGFREAFSGTRFNLRRSIRQDLSTFTWVAMVLAALPLWRVVFLYGWNSAQKQTHQTLLFEALVLTLYGSMVFLKQRHSPLLYKETPA